MQLALDLEAVAEVAVMSDAAADDAEFWGFTDWLVREVAPAWLDLAAETGLIYGRDVVIQAAVEESPRIAGRYAVKVGGHFTTIESIPDGMSPR